MNMKQAILSFLLLILPLLASADTVEIDGIYYNLENVAKTAEVTWGNYSYSGDIIIPETISYDGVVYDVTSIGYYTFGGDKDLISVVIPNSVTSIGNSAFSGCEGLITIDIPNSVTSIGIDAFGGTAWYNNQPDGLVYAGNVLYKYKGEMPENTTVTLRDGTLGISDKAFLECKGLISIDIPSSVTYIGLEAFSKCSNLTSVYIPNSVTSIGIRAFYFCSSLSNIEIPNSVTYIGWYAFDGSAWYQNQQDGLVYAGKVAYRYKGVMPDNTNIIIKEGTLGIADYAFTYCNGLKSVIIPNSVTYIGENAFSSCSSLTSIDIPNGVISIGYSSFVECSKLTSVTISNSVTSIGGSAFSNCSGLTSIIIPNSVTSIAPNAFSGCSSLTSIKVENDNPQYDSRKDCDAIIETSSNSLIIGCKETVIPNSVTSIGDEAFMNCIGLVSIDIPNSVTSIGSSAFYNCSGLTSIDIPNSVTRISFRAFRGCSCLTSVTIPNSVTSIDVDAFYGCSSLTSVTIPKSVTFIGGEAFYNCSKLISVTIPNSVISIGEIAFCGCYELKDVYCWADNVPSIDNFAFSDSWTATLHVPAASIDAYKNTYPWSQFGNIVALTDDDPKPTGIYSLKEDNHSYPISIYSIDGKRLQKAQRGLNIIKMNDGKTIKRIVR